MFSRWRQIALLNAGLIIVSSGTANVVSAADFPKTAGTIIGIVADPGGISQMGATVFLYNRLEKLVKKSLTNERGQFGFDNLVPDTYIVRVSLKSFVPAVREGILVQPGMRSFLNINLASVLSSIEFVYAAPNAPRLLSEDWRWVLRSSMSTRPVLRFLPEVSRPAENIFTNTRGLVRVSAGDGSNVFQGNQPDLGTAFAVATSLYGVNNVQVSGNVGFASVAGMPTASFRTRYSRDSIADGLATGNSPEMQLTVRQAFLPSRTGAALGSGTGPSLGTVTGLFLDRAQLGDQIELTYGAQIESVTYFERLNLISPFARLDVELSKKDAFRIAWSSGSAPEEMYLSRAAAGNDLQQDLSTLSAFPRVSMRGGHAHVQRMTQAEASLSHDVDKDTTVAVSAYFEDVANAALTAVGDTSAYATSEMMPDLFTRSSIFNIGSYQRRGLRASLDRNLGNGWSAHASFGTGGTLQPLDQIVAPGDPGSLRGALRRTQRSWSNVRVSGAIPGIGTRFSAGYMFTDYRAALPAHRYLTQKHSPDVGLNLQFRQPIPSFGMWSGRVEAVAELRNLLEQGYLPLTDSDGRRVVLLPSPRTVRGGLAFIF